tara:strand:+ start:1214 stop:1375 length:162 start_codon:yes stop_codon:yes gene_type:complete
MADIIEVDDFNEEDTSPLKTGTPRRTYNKSKCGEGYKSVKGKCVKIKRGKNGK